MLDAFRRQGNPHGGQIAKGFSKQQGMTDAGGSPISEALELSAADGALEFGEAEVGTETLMEPAKPERSCSQWTQGGCSRPQNASGVLP